MRRSTEGCSLKMERVQDSDWLVELLKETDLLEFLHRIKEELQVTRLEHWKHVTPDDLERIGLSRPSIRRLKEAVSRRKSAYKRQRILSKIAGPGRPECKGSRSANDGNNKNVSDPCPLTCLISAEHLKLFETLGEGSFGVVKRAVWTQPDGCKLNVAAKLLHEQSSMLFEEIVQEVNVMHHLKHENIICLHGLVLAKTIIMVVELCEGGALLDRLRSSTLPRLLVNQLWNFGKQIVRGMAYLEEKRFIHRDLAARNVLLVNEEKVKIGDFGLMRCLPNRDEHYVMSEQKKVPFAWCAPESLKRKQFSHSSDVWMFGVTLWELFSYGEEPWCGCSGAEILRKELSGERLPKPNFCPESIYDLILQCWKLDDRERPLFSALKRTMQKFDFLLATCKQRQINQNVAGGEELDLISGDTILVIDGCADTYYWRGQCVRTREFGLFARKIVRFDNSDQLSEKDISQPLRASFVHAGHGDGRGGESWGFPDKIDPIYLRNPMPLVMQMQQTSATEKLNTAHSTINPGGFITTNLLAIEESATSGSTPSTFYDDGTFDDFNDDQQAASVCGKIYKQVSNQYQPLSSDLQSNNAVQQRQPSAYYSDVPRSPHSQVHDVAAAVNPSSSLYDAPPAADETIATVTAAVCSAAATLDLQNQQSSSSIRQLPPYLHSSGTLPGQRSSWASSCGDFGPGSVSSSDWDTPPPPEDPDPFEIPQDIRQLTISKRYNDHYACGPTAKEVATSWQPITTQGLIAGSQDIEVRLRKNSGTGVGATVEYEAGTTASELNSRICSMSARAPFTVAGNSNQVLQQNLSFNFNNRCSSSGLNTSERSSTFTASSKNNFGPIVGCNSAVLPSKQSVGSYLTSSGANLGASVSGGLPNSANVVRITNDLTLSPRRTRAAVPSSTAIAFNRPVTTTIPPPPRQPPPNNAEPHNAWVSNAAHQIRPPSVSTTTEVINTVPPLAIPCQFISQPQHVPYFHHPSAAAAVDNNGRPSSAAVLQPWRPSFSTTTAKVAADKNILNLFDPLSNAVDNDKVRNVRQGAPFATEARCQKALKQANLNVEKAVQELKLEKLVDIGIASKEQCRRMLESAAWDMDKAASLLLG